MKKIFDLFKKIFNIDQTKKIHEGNSEVVDENKAIEKVRERLGGSKFTISKYTSKHFIKKRKDRSQGASRNINHKRAA
jgi:hypothetical protein